MLGGGDYNRQLRRHPSLGSEVGDRLVKYAVDPGSIDLLWFLDGKEAGWSLRSREVFAGRDDGRRPQRNSDHAARLAVVELDARSPAARRSTHRASRPSRTRGPRPGPSPRSDPRPRSCPSPCSPSRTGRSPSRSRRSATPTKCGRLEDPRRPRGGRAPAGLQAHRRPGLLQQRPGRAIRPGPTTVAASSTCSPGTGSARSRCCARSGSRPGTGRRPPTWGAAHPRRAGRPRQASPRAPRSQVDAVPQRGATASRATTRHVLASEPDPGVPVPAEGPAAPDRPVATEPARDRRRPGPTAPARPTRQADARRRRHQPLPERSDRPAQGASGRDCAGGTSRRPRATTVVEDDLPQAGARRRASAGIPVGAYHFARPDGGDAEEEARFFLRAPTSGRRHGADARPRGHARACRLRS